MERLSRIYHINTRTFSQKFYFTFDVKLSRKKIQIKSGEMKNTRTRKMTQSTVKSLT